MSDSTRMPLATITRAPSRGMITLRGDLDNLDLKVAASTVAGVDMVSTRQIAWGDGRGMAWMSPDEVLIFVPYDEVPSALDTFSKSLSSQHHMAVDVSDARACFVLDGAGVRDVLAKGTPVDLHSAVFAPGELRRTRLGQVACALWLRDETLAEVICFASVAEYVERWLDVAARPGAEVSYLS
ncbi:MAG: sarcosine oxidase subunit gamma family protein [Pseudomonadota bacterium]